MGCGRGHKKLHTPQVASLAVAGGRVFNQDGTEKNKRTQYAL